MQITNRRNVPEIFLEIAQALEQEKRDTFDFSPSTLIPCPRQTQLISRHRDELEVDVIDFYNTFMGNAVHDKLEEGLKNRQAYQTEKRWVLEETDSNGNTYKIGLKPDNYKIPTRHVYDYKVTTVYIRGLEQKPEWEQQVNLYVFFLRKFLGNKEADNVAMPKSASILVFYKDWRESAAQYAKPDKYPPSPIAEFPVPIWSYEEQEAFFKERFNEHTKYISCPDDELPFCSLDDVWEQPAKYAVYKYGAAQATKLCDTLKEAEYYIKQKKLSEVGIEFRPGARRKCEKYCYAAPFCNQYKEWKAQQEAKTVEAITFEPNKAA